MARTQLPRRQPASEAGQWLEFTVPSLAHPYPAAAIPSRIPLTLAIPSRIPLTLEQQHITAVEGIVPTLQNIVATSIALYARGADDNSKCFAAVIICDPICDPKTTALISASPAPTARTTPASSARPALPRTYFRLNSSPHMHISSL
ncbi:hypothetical protein B0H12DRAFT_1238595 [Mycena haematopus]|nr:hypothetical protein B0H12DRAFT_1238587 [Mycena haematopus]KAJ7236082.1 hypothetical protein B0H12DRAFT_1238591 [Mycena haematopus]KAJ7236086.1 hypothetical protein B0H12DRAFT_1238595 [Mycena haematopus]